VNYILDEFSSLPVISDFPAMITAARSRNIRFTLFIQSKHQLVQRYKDEAETIQANCGNWLFLTSRETAILQEISTLCGRVNTRTPVLSEAELQRLDKETGEALLLSGRAKPFITRLPDINLYETFSEHSYRRKWSIPQSKTSTKKMKTLSFQLPILPEELEEAETKKKQLEKMMSSFLHEHPELEDEFKTSIILGSKEIKLGGTDHDI
uniref:TraM recognition domain-containing protein n=1 Tax=Oscillibacter sp. TaxID=1945593 RepID=UPI002D806C8F